MSTTPFIFPLLNIISENPRSNDIRDPEWISALKGFMQSKLDDENSNFNIDLFPVHYLEFLTKCEFDNKEKSIFYAAHYAWSMMKNQDIGNLRSIFWHPHHHNDAYEHFIINVLRCRLVFTSKDPREALVSTYRHWENSTGMFVLPPSETNYLHDDLIFYYISSSLDNYAFYLQNKKSSLVIKTEEMNSDPETIISGLAEFMSIEVTDNLFSSTFLGQYKDSESTRGLKGFDKNINVERWRNELNGPVIIFLELIHYDSLREFGYPTTRIINSEELVVSKGHVRRTMTKVPRSMRKAMLENAKNDAALDIGRHLHPNFRHLEIFLRLMRKYLLLLSRCRNIQKHFSNVVKTQQQSL